MKKKKKKIDPVEQLEASKSSIKDSFSDLLDFFLHKFSLQNTFQEILYKIDKWINEGSGWIVELIESQYITISTYILLSEISYVKLSIELRSPKKGLINIKITIKNVFYGAMVGILIL